MKKIINNTKIIFMLMLVCVLSLSMSVFVGCGNNPDDNGGNTDVNMTASYSIARTQFKAVSGIEVPALENLEADEYPYHAGDNEYCFDITDGSALNYQTYMTFENFFKTTLGNCMENYPAGDEVNGRDAQWIKDGRWYQVMWDSHNHAIYINTTLRQDDNPPQGNTMTESYRIGRQSFYEITGIMLPELSNTELLASSDFNTETNTACFDIRGNAELFGEMVAFLKANMNINPERETTVSISYSLNRTVDGRAYEGFLMAYFDSETNMIAINYSLSGLYTTKVEATAGGTVKMVYDFVEVALKEKVLTVGQKLKLTATADNNYEFKGWFKGETKLSDDNPYTFNTISEDVVITAKFERTNEPEITMTDSYKKSRANFKQITGIEVPEFEKLEADYYEIDENTTEYCFDITGGENLTYQTYLSFENFFKEKLGNCIDDLPEGDEENGRNAEWIVNDRWYQVMWDSYNKAIYINTTLRVVEPEQMTTTYEIARDQFKEVSGIELPVIYKVEAGRIGIDDYRVGTKFYTVDIVSGENCNYLTYQIIENFFFDMFGNFDEGYPYGDGTNPLVDGRVAKWTVNDIVYQTTFTPHGYISINIDKQNVKKMTESYADGRQSFYNISGIMLPEIKEVELDNNSTFNAEKKSAEFVVAGDNALFKTFLNCVKDSLKDNALANNQNHWEDEEFMAFWEWDYADNNEDMHKVTIQVQFMQTKISVGYWFRDYYRITVNTTEGGSAILKKGGRAQENNTSYSVHNTYYELYATPDEGYNFNGWFEGENCLSTENYFSITVSKDIVIEARFSVIPDDMEDDYREARKNLLSMSGITLPKLADVTTSNVNVVFDEENHVRDEFQCEFIFATSDLASETYSAFRNAINEIEGEPEESMENMDLWSVLHTENTIPYRDDVMMHINGKSISLMWRKQPIVFYYVEVEGPGSAYISYTASDYSEQHTNSYWEIADAFHGRVCATPDEDMEFLGWYVNGKIVSLDKNYYFNYNKNNVDFTEITFVAKFSAEPEMTDSYSQAREYFHQTTEPATAIWLPKLAEIDMMRSSFNIGDYQAMFYFESTQNIFDMYVLSFRAQLNTKPTEQDETSAKWILNKKVNVDGEGYVLHKGLLSLTLTDGVLTVNYSLNPNRSTVISDTKGGNIQIVFNNEILETNVEIWRTEGTILLTATADETHDFKGWFIGEENISEESSFELAYYRQNIVVEAHFESKIKMTENYADGRQAIFELTGIMFPEIESLPAIYEVNGNEISFEFTNVDDDIFNEVYDSLKEQIHKKTNFIFYDEFATENNISANWAFNVSVEGERKVKKYLEFFYDSNESKITSHASSIVLYNITIAVCEHGRITSMERDITINSVYFAIPENRELHFEATADDGYAFTGWFINDVFVSTNNPYYYTTTTQDVTIKAVFGDKPQMSESYKTARNNFETYSGILLPEIPEITAYYEDMGNMAMIDLPNVTQDILASIVNTFKTYTTKNPEIGNNGVNIWTYSKEENDKTYNCELRCVLAEDNMIVITLQKDEVQQVEMTESYKKARNEFYAVTGVLVPEISGLIAEDYLYNAGDTSYCFDIFEGDNISEETFNTLKNFFNNLDGWELASHNANGNDSEYYDTYVYTSTGVSIELVLAKYGETGDVFGIFMNAFTK